MLFKARRQSTEGIPCSYKQDLSFRFNLTNISKDFHGNDLLATDLDDNLFYPNSV